MEQRRPNVGLHGSSSTRSASDSGFTVTSTSTERTGSRIGSSRIGSTSSVASVSSEPGRPSSASSSVSPSHGRMAGTSPMGANRNHAGGGSGLGEIPRSAAPHAIGSRHGAYRYARAFTHAHGSVNGANIHWSHEICIAQARRAIRDSRYPRTANSSATHTSRSTGSQTHCTAGGATRIAASQWPTSAGCRGGSNWLEGRNSAAAGAARSAVAGMSIQKIQNKSSFDPSTSALLPPSAPALSN